MNLILTIIIIFCLLLLGEILWKKTKIHNEFTRKFVHISVGAYVAFFPYILSGFEIKLISAAFLFAVLFSKYFNVFKSIHNVPRLTEGEFWFALTVLLLAFSPVRPQVFTVSLLIMSLADGLAAIVGTHYGKNNSYKIMDSTKSMAGTATFFIVSVLLLGAYSYFTTGPTLTAWFIPISVVATALENLSYRGIDNFTVPITVATMLYLL